MVPPQSRLLCPGLWTPTWTPRGLGLQPPALLAPGDFHLQTCHFSQEHFLGDGGFGGYREFFVFKCPQEILSGFSRTSPSSVWYPKLHLTEASHLGPSWAAARTHPHPLPGQPLEGTGVLGEPCTACPRREHTHVRGWAPGLLWVPREGPQTRDARGGCADKDLGAHQFLTWQERGVPPRLSRLPHPDPFHPFAADRREAHTCPLGFLSECKRLFWFLPRDPEWAGRFVPGPAELHRARQPRVQQGTEVSPAPGTPTLGTTQHQEGGGLRLRVQGLQRDKRLQCVSRGQNDPRVRAKAAPWEGHSTSSQHRL